MVLRNGVKAFGVNKQSVVNDTFASLAIYIPNEYSGLKIAKTDVLGRVVVHGIALSLFLVPVNKKTYFTNMYLAITPSMLISLTR